MVPSAIFVKENNVFNMIISSDLFKLYINLNTNKMEWIEIDNIKYYNDAFNSVDLNIHYLRNNFDNDILMELNKPQIVKPIIADIGRVKH